MKQTTETAPKSVLDLSVQELERCIEIKQEIESLNTELDDLLENAGEFPTGEYSTAGRERIGKGGTAQGQPWTESQRRNFARTMKEKRQRAREEAQYA